MLLLPVEEVGEEEARRVFADDWSRFACESGHACEMGTSTVALLAK